MTSWFSAWIPSLPSVGFSLPHTIQRRFISFFLRKTLGHFLRPGQLDVHQVDTQIGSGHVQVNDLELDNQAINNLLHGLPLELHDGSIGSVTARIPMPNPLTSTIGFSVRSLHLTFHLVPTIHHSSGSDLGVDLADSVASLAESFVHDELNPREEASLRESRYSEADPVDDDHNVPGGLDPFLVDPDDSTFQSDSDPAGVSMFAVLIERLLARFECDASNIKLTIVSPGESSFTLSIGSVSYAAETVKDDTQTSGTLSGETRKVIINNVQVTARDLRSPPTTSPAPWNPRSSISGSTLYARGVSPASSSSSLDEDTQLMMSQSIACLPQRPASPASSVASSMYASAISTAFTPGCDDTRDDDNLLRSSPVATETSVQREPSSRPSPSPEPPTYRTPPSSGLPSLPIVPHEEPILSFGSESIIVCLTTPHPAAPTTQESPTSAGSTSRHGTHKASKERLKLTIAVGVITSSLRARHIRALMDTAERWSLYHIPELRPIHPHPSTSSKSTSSMSFNLESLITVKGVVILAIPSLNSSTTSDEDVRMLHNFHTHPLVPPTLPYPYVRLHVESIWCSLPSIELKPSPSSGRRVSKLNQATTKTTATLLISDVSVFAVHPHDDTIHSPGDIFAAPILITDDLLPSQYSPFPSSPSHSSIVVSAPAFPVLDFTDKAHWHHGVRPSFWRTKNRQKGHPARADPVSPSQTAGNPESHDHTAAVVQLRVSQVDAVQDIAITVAPLHIFLDLGQAIQAGGVLTFVDEILKPSPILRTPEQPVDPIIDAEGEGDITPPATPRLQSHASETTHERDRRRIEKMVMDDLDLDLDYRVPATSRRATQHEVSKPGHKRKPKTVNRNDVTVNLTMIRVQARCPSPPRYSQRSGALVLDLHHLRLCTGTEGVSKPSTKFATPGEVDEAPLANALVSVDFGGVLVALSLAGAPKSTVMLSTTILSLTPHKQDSDVSPIEPHKQSSPQCRLVVLKPHSTNDQASAVSLVAELPSMRVVLPKDLLDGVQYWADDVSQLLEGLSKRSSSDYDSDADSRDASLIGSRFFAKSRSASTMGSGLTVGRSQPPKSEIVVKVVLSQVHLLVLLPHPLIVDASSIDVLLELKPEGKDQTVLTLGVMDVTVTYCPESGAPLRFLSLTTPRTMAYASHPLIKLRLTSLVVPETTSKETRIHLTLCGFTYTIHPSFAWVDDLAAFAKAPPGAFESVIPSERTKVVVKVSDGSLRALAPSHPGAVLLYIGDLAFSTVVGEPSRSSYNLTASDVTILAIDKLSNATTETFAVAKGSQYWKSFGYALITEFPVLEMSVLVASLDDYPNIRIVVERIGVRIHLCADTMTAVTAFVSDLTMLFDPPGERPPKPKRQPSVVSEQPSQPLSSILVEHTFNVNPEMGPSMDMISDDLPTNPYYLDEHFGSAAGLRELRDDDLDDFDDDVAGGPVDISDDMPQLHATSHAGSETIRVLNPQGLHFVENFFDDLPAIPEDGDVERGPTTLQVRVNNGDVTLLLYDGYDWERTRRVIEEEVKEMRRRLAKIRQLVATGQLPDENEEETSAVLFNSMYIGLEKDPGELDPTALISAIDEELREDTETISQGSWESLMPPTSGKPQVRPTRVHGKKLTRSKRPRIEICLSGVVAEVDKYKPDDPTVSRTFVTVKELEILDHIKTSTWKKFLTSMRLDSKGIIRETGSNMVRIELLSVRPVPNHPSEEARLKAKILPLRLYVDQDALDFLKKFFSFKDTTVESASNDSEDGDDVFFQHAEVFPVDLKLDYKPRRVDYRALREGKTIELMNFFHFDGAEMTLRHITLSGITGWPRFFDLLNDLWTPDVKATQLMDVISGVSPIRSVVNVGSGVADLVLLPIAQFKKDGRVVRGLQRGANSFVKSTAMEAIKLGARLATGTQVILEQAEGVMGGQFDQAITAEALQAPIWEEELPPMDDDEAADVISKYADQPTDIREGMQSAYKSLRRNFNSAAQTILAVPMEVYERSGNEGPVRAVIRAVPIAVLKPMIGASEAISKTLMGLHNTLDPNVQFENEEKYKQR